MGSTLKGRVNLILPVLLPAFLITIWWIGSAGSTSYIFPPLSSILDTFTTTWLSLDGVRQAAPSILNFLVGYLAACLFGVVIGSFLGVYAPVREALTPALDYLRSLPPPVLLPLAVLVLGIGNEMKMVVICLGSIWPIIFSTMEGVRGAEQVRISMARIFQLRRRDRWRLVILPDAAPHIMAGMHASLQMAFVLIVISEFVASSSGIGFTILQASRTFQLDEMWAGVIFLGLLGLLLNYGFEWLKRRVLKWQIEEVGASRGL